MVRGSAWPASSRASSLESATETTGPDRRQASPGGDGARARMPPGHRSPAPRSRRSRLPVSDRIDHRSRWRPRRLRVAADAQIQWVMGQKSGAGFDYFENYRSTSADQLPTPPRRVEPDARRRPAVPDQGGRLEGPAIAGRPVRAVRASARPGRSTRPAPPLPGSWVTTDEQGVAVLDWLPKDDWALHARGSVEDVLLRERPPPSRSGWPAGVDRPAPPSDAAERYGPAPRRAARGRGAGLGVGEQRRPNPGFRRTLTGADGTYAPPRPPRDGVCRRRPGRGLGRPGPHGGHRARGPAAGRARLRAQQGDAGARPDQRRAGRCACGAGVGRAQSRRDPCCRKSIAGASPGCSPAQVEAEYVGPDGAALGHVSILAVTPEEGGRPGFLGLR